MSIMGAVALAAGTILVLGVRVQCLQEGHNPFVDFAKRVDTGSLKVCWVTYQIMASTTFNLDLTYPPPFSTMLGLLNVFSFDFISVECFQDAGDRYFNTVYLYSIAPLVVAFMVMAVGGMRVCASVVKGGSISDANHIKSQHLWVFLFLTYIVLPPVAMKQLQALDCIPFAHDSSSFLRVDTGIDCSSSRYVLFRSRVFIFIFIYQCIPLIWLLLLYVRRDALNPPVSKSDANLALYVRDKDVSLKSLRFLFDRRMSPFSRVVHPDTRRQEDDSLPASS